MVRSIEERTEISDAIQFVIVSGDLAHGGKEAQYDLVREFLDDLLAVLKLKRNDVFFVPGNHDVDRDVNELAFHGSRTAFSTPEEVDRFLGNQEELHLLKQRLSSFYEFARSFGNEPCQKYTDDGLAYIAVRQIGDLPIGIVGLNSAFTCGNDEDERNIIIGDRPMIDVFECMRGADVRLMLGVVHHPAVWLRDFDQATLENRLLPLFDILHRGHLHEPGVKPIATSQTTNCLEIAAGAGFVWRQFENSYSVVSVDVPSASCTTANFEYEVTSGKFKQADEQSRTLQFRGDIPGDTIDLVNTFANLGSSVAEVSFYLAAIVDGKTSEIPIPIADQILFASPQLLEHAEDQVYVEVATRFLGIRNSLLAFSSETPLSDRVRNCSAAIIEFADSIVRFASEQTGFKQAIASRNDEASKLCSFDTEHPQNTFIAALNQLNEEQDWEGLKTMARRYRDIESSEVRRASNRHLAFALSFSDEEDDRTESRQIIADLLLAPCVAETDFEIAFAVFRSHGRVDEASQVLLDALERFNPISRRLSDLGYSFASEQGNEELKQRLDEATGK